MSFNNYMSKCLTDENHGYYMKRDVFNTVYLIIIERRLYNFSRNKLNVWRNDRNLVH